MGSHLSFLYRVWNPSVDEVCISVYYRPSSVLGTMEIKKHKIKSLLLSNVQFTWKEKKQVGNTGYTYMYMTFNVARYYAKDIIWLEFKLRNIIWGRYSDLLSQVDEERCLERLSNLPTFNCKIFCFKCERNLPWKYRVQIFTWCSSSLLLSLCTCARCCAVPRTRWTRWDLCLWWAKWNRRGWLHGTTIANGSHIYQGPPVN